MVEETRCIWIVQLGLLVCVVYRVESSQRGAYVTGNWGLVLS